MNLSRCFDREPGVIARRIAGEMILVPMHRRAQEMGLFTLNEVGCFVWERLDGQSSLEAIAEALEQEFEVEATLARSDLLEFVGILAQTGCAREVAR